MGLVGTPKWLLVFPVGLMIVGNPLLLCIGIGLASILFVVQFSLNPSLSRFLSYLGPCLVFLGINCILKFYFPGVMDPYLQGIIDYVILSISPVLIDMIEIRNDKKKDSNKIKSGPSLKGFE